LRTLKAFANTVPVDFCQRFQRFEKLDGFYLGRCPRLKLANAFGVSQL
jgi:hypothetical protein